MQHRPPGSMDPTWRGEKLQDRESQEGGGSGVRGIQVSRGETTPRSFLNLRPVPPGGGGVWGRRHRARSHSF